jgi:hypothetical protein
MKLNQPSNESTAQIFKLIKPIQLTINTQINHFINQSNRKKTIQPIE